MNEAALDKIVDYTRQFIEAATPAAKQAYEVGLLTLRIDAAQTLLYGVIAAVVAIAIGRRMKAWFRAELDDETVGFCAPIVMLGGVACLIATIIAACTIGDVWVWAKLFAPDLWLAHQAIEKLVN